MAKPPPGRVTLLGCGTSYHAGQVIARVLHAVAGIPAEVVIASEYDPRLAGGDLTVAISQSGETADLLTALDAVEGPVVAITNSMWSSLARRADAVLDCRAGQERGVAATKSFTAQVLQGIGLALAAATARGRTDQVQEAQRALRRLPDEIAAADVVLPMPISPRQSRSAPPASASMPKAMVATQARSSSASPCVKSPVGKSSARSKTLKPRSKAAQIWLMAAPPAAKFSSIWRVTVWG